MIPKSLTPKSHKITTEELLALHQATSAECYSTMKAKNSDYTGGSGVDDPFANFNMAAAMGVDPVIGILLRMGDKMQRIRSFVNDGGLKVKNETVYDACEDIVNYAILIKAMCVEKAREVATRVTY
jgi:hypothetical protein